MCKFSNLTFGQLHTLSVQRAYCLTCGTDVVSLVNRRVAIYQGHAGTEDFFNFVTPFFCPGCNSKSVFHMEECDTGIEVTEEFKLLQNIDTQKFFGY